MPSSAAVFKLYRSFLREGKKFPNYNVREYVQRQAREKFRENAAGKQSAAVDEQWSKARETLALVQRQAIVYTLYARKNKSIMDMPLQQVLSAQPPSDDH